MVARAVVEAIEGKLAADWTETPIVGVLTPDAKPLGNVPFILVQYPITNSEQASIGAPGDNWWRDEGVFSLLVHQKKSRVELALQQADELAAMFRGKDIDGVRCWAPSGAAFDDGNDQALYYVVSVAVPYWYDHRG